MPNKPPPPAAQRADYDTPWKDVLERWHRQFLEFFFPLAAADIDWSHGLNFSTKSYRRSPGARSWVATVVVLTDDHPEWRPARY